MQYNSLKYNIASLETKNIIQVITRGNLIFTIRRLWSYTSCPDKVGLRRYLRNRPPYSFRKQNFTVKPARRKCSGVLIEIAMTTKTICKLIIQNKFIFVAFKLRAYFMKA